jgi:hypothetical protein
LGGLVLGALLDFVDLVGDEPVCLAMDGHRSVRVRRLDEAEDLSGLLVDLVVPVVDAVLVLRLDVLLVCFRNVLRGNAALHIVDVYEQRHRRPP